MSKFNLLYSHVFEDNEVRTAPLATIDFSRLTSKDPEEVAKLRSSCEKYGFFYLSLQNGGTCQISSAMQDLLRLMELYFDQPQEVKMEHNVGSMTFG
jgi:isopenicillin N synthase-like dioxygenase